MNSTISRFLRRAMPATCHPGLLRRALLPGMAGAMTGLVLFAVPPDGAAADAPRVRMKTSLGDLVLELYPDKAPKSVANFLKYVDDGHYANTVFHRVIGSFMIQGGGFDKEMKQKATREPVAIESRNGLKNDRGTIAMARTSVPDSATSQFFINTVDNDSLNFPKPDGHGYTVFGKVVEGLDTVDKIAKVRTASRGGHGDVPVEPVTIESVSRVTP